MKKRWVCPVCGDGLLAPGKPRRDDVRRYCLDCSRKSGRLVQRTCPSLETAREVDRERRLEQAKAKRARIRKVREGVKAAAKAHEIRESPESYTVEGKTLLAWARWMWRVLSSIEPRNPQPMPEVTIGKIRYAREEEYSTGKAWLREVRVRIPQPFDPATSGGKVLGTLLHELVHSRMAAIEGYALHLGTWRQRSKRRASHDWRFQMLLVEAAKALWDVDVKPQRGAYKTTWELENVLQARMAIGFTKGCLLPEEQPAQPAVPAEGNGDVLLR